MDALSSLLKDFDIANFLPEINTVMDKINLFCRICILLAPILVLLFGLKFLFLPAKNMKGTGFRNFYVTGSMSSWRFTQRFAGLCWSVTGGTMLIGALILSFTFKKMDPLAIFKACLICLVIEMVLVLASRITITLNTAKYYDIKGKLRPGKAPVSKKKAKEQAE